MAEDKTKATEVSVTAFIETIPDGTKRADAKAIVKLMQSVTGVRAKKLADVDRTVLEALFLDALASKYIQSPKGCS